MDDQPDDERMSAGPIACFYQSKALMVVAVLKEGKMFDHLRVLDFWFVETMPRQWFKKDADFDAALRSRFVRSVEDALEGKLESWRQHNDSSLALILLLDQFPRNIFRGTPRAYSGDSDALEISKECVQRGDLAQEKILRRPFILMPMMHSEDIAVQNASLAMFLEHCTDESYRHAVRHRDVIHQFGRFPHRNSVLGRASTNEEIEFLMQPGSSF